MRFVKPVMVMSLFLIATPAHTAEVPKGAKPGLLIQISDDDPAKWNQALNIAHNVQVELGSGKVNVEIVAFGPGIAMLKFESETGSRIEKAAKDGIAFKACQNTMKGQKLTKDDMHPNAGYVKAGAIEIIDRHREGWAYLKL